MKYIIPLLLVLCVGCGNKGEKILVTKINCIHKGGAVTRDITLFKIHNPINDIYMYTNVYGDVMKLRCAILKTEIEYI